MPFIRAQFCKFLNILLENRQCTQFFLLSQAEMGC